MRRYADRAPRARRRAGMEAEPHRRAKLVVGDVADLEAFQQLCSPAGGSPTAMGAMAVERIMAVTRGPFSSIFFNDLHSFSVPSHPWSRRATQ